MPTLKELIQEAETTPEPWFEEGLAFVVEDIRANIHIFMGDGPKWMSNDGVYRLWLHGTPLEKHIQNTGNVYRFARYLSEKLDTKVVGDLTNDQRDGRMIYIDITKGR